MQSHLNCSVHAKIYGRMYVRPLSFLNVAHQHMNFSSESLTRNDFYVQSTRAHTTQQTLTITAEKKET